MHTGETWNGHKYSDDNPRETFIRYYKHPFGYNYDENGYPKSSFLFLLTLIYTKKFGRFKNSYYLCIVKLKVIKIWRQEN